MQEIKTLEDAVKALEELADLAHDFRRDAKGMRALDLLCAELLLQGIADDITDNPYSKITLEQAEAVIEKYQWIKD